VTPLQWSDTRRKKSFCGQIYKELWSNEVGQVKNVRSDTLQGGDNRVKLVKVTVMSKKGRQFFSEKIGVTPSVAAPGDTNPSDATVSQSVLLLYILNIFYRYFLISH